MRILKAAGMCFSMFSIIPMPMKCYDARNRTLMLAFLPVVGLVIGCAWWGAAELVRSFLGASAIGCALLAAIPYLLSGFIHLDGFMDVSDALMSHRSLEERLRIMKDPHTGAFAVISTIMLFMFSFAAMLTLMEKGFDMRGLIAIPIMTRACSAVCVAAVKPLGHSQYSGERSMGDRTFVICFALVCVIVVATFALYALGLSGLSAILASAVFCLVVWIEYKKFGGVSGDISGYALCVSETVALCSLAVLAEVLA